MQEGFEIPTIRRARRACCGGGFRCGPLVNKRRIFFEIFAPVVLSRLVTPGTPYRFKTGSKLQQSDVLVAPVAAVARDVNVLATDFIHFLLVT